MANKWDERKKAQEDEYFIKKERELLEKLKAKQGAEAQQPAQSTAELKCPRCGQILQEQTFQKILIDQCPGCHGIWLDAGELQQIAGKEDDSWLGKFWKRDG
jgi:uncharacterized protein